MLLLTPASDMTSMEYAAWIGMYHLVILIVLVVSIGPQYVLEAIGYYRIAQRRNVLYPWLAWIPIGRTWLLGSIADDYQDKCHGVKKSK